MASFNPVLSPPQIQCKRCFFANYCHLTSPKIIQRQIKLKKHQSLNISSLTSSPLFAIQTGLIKTWHTEINGKEKIAHFYFPGEILGLNHLAQEKQKLTVSSLTDSVLCEIPATILEVLYKNNLIMMEDIIQFVGKQATNHLYLRSTYAEQKLAGFILDLSYRLSSNELALTFRLPLSHEAIGNYLGLAPETISRLLTYLQQSRILAINNKHVTLLNVAKLRQLADEAT